MPRTQGLQGAYINRQYELFSWLETRLGSLPERYQTLILIFEMICVEDYITRPIRSRLVSRDSTAIDAREKPAPKEEKDKQEVSQEDSKEKKPKEPRRLEKQQTMELGAMLEELPKDCNVGCKRNAQGHSNSWTGFKLHMDTTDEGIPVSFVVTSALLHDSQAAIPLLRITEQRVTNLYDLMDATYDAQEIIIASLNSGYVPIVDTNPRNKKAEHKLELKAQRNARYTPPEQIRYRNRSSVERAFGRIRDELGGRNIRVRGYQKVTCHLMFSLNSRGVEDFPNFSRRPALGWYLLHVFHVIS